VSKARDEHVALRGAYSELQAVVRAQVSQAASLQAAVGPVVSSLRSQIKKLRDDFWGEMQERKRLFNLVQELRGNIRVFCRVRPRIASEIAAGHEECVRFPEEDSVLVTRGTSGTEKLFQFDKVFQQSSTNVEVFSEVSSLVTTVMDGYNVCIFAYGQVRCRPALLRDGAPSRFFFRADGQRQDAHDARIIHGPGRQLQVAHGAVPDPRPARGPVQLLGASARARNVWCDCDTRAFVCRRCR
jgi:hypothetical protein